MKIFIFILALTVIEVFGQAGTQGDVDVDDQLLYTCMNRCMCSCNSAGYGSIMLEGNNTSSEEPESEAPVTEEPQSEPENTEPVSDEPDSEEPTSEEPKSEPTTTEEPGFKYNFNIKRTYTIVSKNKIVNIGKPPTPKQEIVYGETVNRDTKLMLAADLYDLDRRRYVYAINRSGPVNICNDEYRPGSWANVVLQITRNGLMPFGKCPVEPGTYVVSQIYNVSATFEDELNCGKYKLTTNSYANERHVIKSIFEWTVSDNCN